ncbi:DUF3105 domain-containing protein [Deinococcus roseus]|nr:DUF3105 domain-containing protein [Deinococcus roseus]
MKIHVLIVAVLGVATLAQAQTGQTSQQTTASKVVLKKIKTEKSSAGTITFYEDASNTGVIHATDPVNYPFYPPVMGLHHPTWANCGIYLKTIDARMALHSLEHGALWVTFKPTTEARKLAFLQTLVKGNPYRLMSLEARQTADVVLTVWGVQLVVSTWDEKAIKDFADQYTNGPTTPEPGAPCSGGVKP